MQEKSLIGFVIYNKHNQFLFTRTIENNIIDYYTATNSVSAVQKLLLNITYFTKNHRSEFVETETGTQINLYTDCVVDSVDSMGLGYKMGIQKDDIITSATIIRGGEEINYNFKQAYEISELMLNVRANDVLILKIKRGDVTISTTSQTIISSMLIAVD